MKGALLGLLVCACVGAALGAEFAFNSYSNMDQFSKSLGIPPKYQCYCSTYMDHRAPKVHCRCIKGNSTLQPCGCTYPKKPNMHKVTCFCDPKPGTDPSARLASTREDAAAAAPDGVGREDADEPEALQSTNHALPKLEEYPRAEQDVVIHDRRADNSKGYVDELARAGLVGELNFSE